MRMRFVCLSVVLALAACQSAPSVKPVERVDLDRFMGPWYVIANIPTFIEKEAHNPVESYAKAEDGTIETTFTFRDGAFDGPKREYHPRGFVRDDSGAVWGMQFIWPFKGEFVISHVDPDYKETIIARSARDYIWIMARTPVISESDYARLIEKAKELGYDATKIQKCPQKWD